MATPGATNTTPAAHDYAVYTRHQIRLALRYKDLNQYANRLPELYRHAQEWDRNNAPDAIYKYIIADKVMATTFMTGDKMKQDKNQWKADVKHELDAQKAEAEESAEKSEEALEEKSDEESYQEQDSPVYDFVEAELSHDEAGKQNDSDEGIMAGLSEEVSTISMRDRTTDPVTFGSFHAHNASRTPRAIYKTAGATKTESKRLAERDNENASMSEQTSAADYFITRSMSGSGYPSSIAQSKPSKANMSNPTNATVQDTVDRASAVDVPETEGQEVDKPMIPPRATWKDPNVPGHGKARMKKTPAAALAKRERENAEAEAATAKKRQENIVLDEANRAEIRSQEEEAIEKDKAYRKTVENIEAALKLQYHSPYNNGGHKLTEEQMRELLMRKAARGENLFPGIAGAKK